MNKPDDLGLLTLALRYLDALEKENQKTLTELWRQAETNPEIERLLLDLNEGRISESLDIDWRDAADRCQAQLQELLSVGTKATSESERIERNGQILSSASPLPCCPKPPSALRILHTGDWHLGDRLGSRGLDRTEDLQGAVKRIADYCEEYQVDVLLVAGDLFSDKLGAQKDLSGVIRHLSEVFRSFLVRGGTILALTGNHDKDAPCQTLRNTLNLAAPQQTTPGSLAKPGRLYLATGPTFFRLAAPNGTEVQFILMPYPTPQRYFDGSGRCGGSREERNRQLQAAYTSRLQQFEKHPAYRVDRPTVLSAHVHVKGASFANLFRISEREDVIVPEADIPTGFAYVALGHIHQPQCISGLSHVRYCGSIERLDLGDKGNDKSVVVVDIGPEGRLGEPTVLPLEATPIYEVVIDNPREQLSRIHQQYPDADRALVRCKLIWRAGEDNREEIQRRIEALFPRWYDWDVSEAGTTVPSPGPIDVLPDSASHREIILSFLGKTLEADPDREDLLRLTETLLEECA